MSTLPTRAGRTAIAILSLCLLPGSGRAADDTARIRAIVDGAIRPVMAEYDVPGMAVAVTVGGQAYVFNYGLASRASATPVDDATIFEIGSISKLFTATLASYAQAQGKLSWDDHPGKYLPALKGSPIDQATLLHLGTYTAGGLPLQFPDAVPDDGMLGYFQQWQPDAAPGVQRRYSNPSLGLFGHLAALALGRDFAEAMESEIFPGFGLGSTYLRMPAGAMGHYAWGYDQANQPVRMQPDIFDAQAYGVRTTAADMIRFVQANIAPQRLAEPVRRAVAGTQIGYFQVGDMTQGLGWEQYAYPVSLQRLLAGNAESMIWDANAARRLTPPQPAPAATLFDKTGSTRGFGGYVAFVPARRIGVVMLANRSYPIPARVRAGHAVLRQLAALAPMLAPVPAP